MKRLGVPCMHPYQIHLLIFMILTAVVCLLTMVNLVSMPTLYISWPEKLHNYFGTQSHTSLGAIQFLETISESEKHGLNETKVILLWCPVFGGGTFLKEGKNSFANSGCPENRCEITSDRSRLLESHAVLFHIRTLSLLDVPHNRTITQKWIFFTLESPPYSEFSGFSFMFGMFNWTMSYRNDSDIVIRYGSIKPNAKNAFNLSHLYLNWREKTKIAVWMVSHCSTVGNREKYVEQLQNYIDIDTYGFCGKAVCDFNKTNICLENFSKKYFFYLAFENTICEDYITEKFYRVLHYDMIPVVFGGGNYLAVAPAGSYINALDFDSPKKLSSHLYRVASNFTLFSNYFKWKVRGYDIRDYAMDCDLCEKLHSHSFLENSVYYDINKWWIKDANCRSWKEVK
ncbi:alpha-(1,3)-fucosyltransferase C-like [Stegodyphus dumicola]|uniref:alpha-(1,3)-fucosyltransferase C-like n=1 Tax=Stegodyphus dumicola TaxID=202533 RepID=UPI0015B35AC9|nr:alpha-(1,3)-fucosyltransferase C-like [Stegodyphus dumicola]XP_035217425.1 alpha-(1,3)-fucosyltransferase C-like [Stegodyphus dumicola]